MSSYSPEQQAIFETCSDLWPEDIVTIIAPAGSGKTFTLVEIAKRLPDKEILYLAYNKAIEKEATRKFPKNTTVKTIHGLAYTTLGIKQEQLKENDYNAFEICEVLNIKDMEFSAAALKMFNDFCNSDYKEFPKTSIDNEKVRLAAKVLFDKMKRREILITHSFYLKEFEMLEDKKMKEYDVVLLDEAQDSNPVTLSFFLGLRGSKILVGDPNQAIYSFRGAINAFNAIDATHQMRLTRCYRCCPDIIHVANQILNHYKPQGYNIISQKDPLKDGESVSSVARITRTNSEIVNVLSDNKANIEYVLVKHPDDIFKPVLNVVNFLKGRKDKISDTYYYLRDYTSENQLVALIQQSGDIELSKALSLAKRYGDGIFKIYMNAKKLYSSKRKLTHPVYLMTAHTSKGLEFDEVYLSRDFPCLENLLNKDNQTSAKFNEEVNLYYVAVTRAKYILHDETKNWEYVND